MAQELYIVNSDRYDPYYNLALEEYLLQRTPEEGCILYLWQNDHTVVIGRNQNPWAECRTSLLQEEGGRLARRLSGGGAVYHDLGNLNFTFLCCESSYDLQKQLSVIQKAALHAGVDAQFSGRNDLLAEGRKFSGNAFYHSKGKAYHHGTLLIDTDTEKLGRYLSPPKAKLQSKGVSSVRSRVVNLKSLSPALTCETMKQYMQQAFSEIYAGTAKELILSETDIQAVTALKCRYESEDWLFCRPLPFSCILEEHFSWGHLQLQLQVENGIIQDLQVYTDANDHTLADVISRALSGTVFSAEGISGATSQLDIGADLTKLFKQAL